MIDKILYHIVFTIFYAIALLPLSILYVISDILYFFVYFIAGYRVTIVRKNLAEAFPEKSIKERIKTEKEFYRHFCDYFFETIKLLHISDKEMRSRMIFKNTDLVSEHTKQGKSVILYLGHYGNWEWVTSITLWLDKNIKAAQIYRPLKNKIFDNLFLNLRKRFGSLGISKNSTLRSIIKLRQEKQTTIIGFMADQTPSKNNIHYWTRFMNQDTAVFTGVERIAKQVNYCVLYLDVKKVSRGKYEGEIKLLSERPKEEPEFAITERYIREMENTILSNPAYWLWTHKRWKYKIQDFNM